MINWGQSMGDEEYHVGLPQLAQMQQLARDFEPYEAHNRDPHNVPLPTPDEIRSFELARSQAHTQPTIPTSIAGTFGNSFLGPQVVLERGNSDDRLFGTRSNVLSHEFLSLIYLIDFTLAREASQNLGEDTLQAILPPNTAGLGSRSYSQQSYRPVPSLTSPTTYEPTSSSNQSSTAGVIRVWSLDIYMRRY